jgi:hypothetical protein
MYILFQQELSPGVLGYQCSCTCIEQAQGAEAAHKQKEIILY